MTFNVQQSLQQDIRHFTSKGEAEILQNQIDLRFLLMMNWLINLSPTPFHPHSPNPFWKKGSKTDSTQTHCLQEIGHQVAPRKGLSFRVCKMKGFQKTNESLRRGTVVYQIISLKLNNVTVYFKTSHFYNYNSIFKDLSSIRASFSVSPWPLAVRPTLSVFTPHHLQTAPSLLHGAHLESYDKSAEFNTDHLQEPLLPVKPIYSPFPSDVYCSSVHPLAHVHRNAPFLCFTLLFLLPLLFSFLPSVFPPNHPPTHIYLMLCQV